MIRNIAFALSMIVYVGFPLQMINSYEDVLKEGEVFRFKHRPVDPYHPFKGRYVSLYYDNLSLEYENARDVFVRGMKAYVSLEKDNAGIACVSNIYLDPPEKGSYLQVYIDWTSKNKVSFDYPFQEYFMNEKMAPLAEEEVRKFSNREKEEVFIDVRVKEGIAVIEQLYIKDTPIEDFLRDNAQ